MFVFFGPFITHLRLLCLSVLILMFVACIVCGFHRWSFNISQTKMKHLNIGLHCSIIYKYIIFVCFFIVVIPLEFGWDNRTWTGFYSECWTGEQMLDVFCRCGIKQPGGRRILLPGWDLPPPHTVWKVLRTSWYGTMDPSRWHSGDKRGFLPPGAMWKEAEPFERRARWGASVDAAGRDGGNLSGSLKRNAAVSQPVSGETVALLRGWMKAKPGLFCSLPAVWLNLFNLFKVWEMFFMCNYLNFALICIQRGLLSQTYPVPFRCYCPANGIKQTHFRLWPTK